MPTRILINSTNEPHNWISDLSDIWDPDTNQDTGDGVGLDTTTDTARLDANSGVLYLGGNVTCIGLNGTGYTEFISGSAYNLIINGDLFNFPTFGGTGIITVSGTGDHSLLAGAGLTEDLTLKFTATSGTPTFLANTVTLGNLTIDNNPTSFIMLDDMVIAGDFIYTAGKIDFLTNNVAVRMTGASADIQLNNSANLFDLLTIAAGTTIRRTSAVNARKLVIEAAAELSATNVAFFMKVRPVVDNFLQVLGDVTTARLQILSASDRANSLDLSNVVQLDILMRDATLTWSGLLEVDALNILALSAGEFGRLLMAASGYSLGNVLLGDAGNANRVGKLDLAGFAGSIGSLAQARAADTTPSEMDFGASYLESSGLLNFTGVAVLVDGVAYLRGGGVSNLDSVGITGGVLHCFGTTDVSGNTAAIAAGEVTFDQHAPPGSLATLGVGI